MKTRQLLLVTVLLTPGLSVAGSNELPLRWSELEPALARGKIRALLPNGSRIEGKVIAVQPEAMRIEITKTSDRSLQPGGPALIPRSSISVVEVVRYGARWRAVGAAIGPALVIAAGAGVAGSGAGTVNDIGKYIGYGAAAVIGTGVGGYYLGKRADRRVTTIRIVRENQGAHHE